MNLVAYATKLYFRAVNLEFPSFSKGQLIPNIGKTTKLSSFLVKALFSLHQIDLSKEQFILLLCLEQGSKRQSSLADITERDKGSLTRLVQSLEKKGFIKRRVCGRDSRVNYVEIDRKGREILEKAKPIMLELFQSLQNGIDPEHHKITIQVLETIQNNAIQEFEKIDLKKNKK